MPSDFKISVASQQAACDAIVDRLDLGSGAATGKIETRTGAPPASCAAADSGTLLVTNLFANPAFGNANSSGVATANAIAPGTAVASADAGHFRAKDRDGNCVFQGTAGEAADTPDMTLNEKSIVSGGTVNANSATVTMPAS